MKVTRRAFLRYGLEAGAMVGLVGGLSVLSVDAAYVRPPRALSPEAFTSRCMRCGVCVEVCPTRCLSLVDLTLDVRNMSTPEIAPRFGGCEAWATGCKACAEACPTGALDPLRQLADEKPGHADLEPNRCVNCMVCFIRCPVPGAVLFPNPDGEPFTREQDIPTRLKLRTSPLKPYIDATRCVGCGLCVHYCPEHIMSLEPEVRL
ncbi:ferredoxin-type protein NapG [Desulfobaculum xiamenense]|uniref:Ferredoxin-type protein NapG n=1 Tax=Desulfobaculum xiamenense TaxID=995050 RepID=A0A846QPA2_9BACT|nr:4Fe-4S binding protein [Desulfobaculum xiamenense]NJB68312.1 ferredoxin-type protein NapG [Desulfobaculum xiamenense]